MRGLLALGCVLLAACATPREPVLEVLDPQTGITVVRLAEPVELIAGPALARDQDPFAFLAPFETNRQGVRTPYLWTGLPLEGAGIVRCGNLELPVGGLAPGDVGLSVMPYRSPAPWIVPKITAVTPEWFDCLGSGETITLGIGTDGARHHVLEAGSRPPLQEFAARTRH